MEAVFDAGNRLRSDHVQMCLKVPPHYSLAFVIGFLKGKSAVRIHRWVLGTKRVTGMHFRARGYCDSGAVFTKYC